MAQNFYGAQVPAGSDAFDPQGDMVELADSLAGMVIIPVTSTADRAAKVSSLGWTPSAARPVYVHRADAAPTARLEVSEDGSNWRTVFTEVGRVYTDDGAGGGNLSTSWALSSDPATVTLPAGSYVVHASMGFTLSPSASVRAQCHLFDSGGTAFGTNQDAYRQVPSGGDQSFTMEFSRFITVPSGGRTVQIRRRTSATGGTQSSAFEHLTAVRVG